MAYLLTILCKLSAVGVYNVTTVSGQFTTGGVVNSSSLIARGYRPCNYVHILHIASTIRTC